MLFVRVDSVILSFSVSNESPYKLYFPDDHARKRSSVMARILDLRSTLAASLRQPERMQDLPYSTLGCISGAGHARIP